MHIFMDMGEYKFLDLHTPRYVHHVGVRLKINKDSVKTWSKFILLIHIGYIHNLGKRYTPSTLVIFIAVDVEMTYT
jgi:hypothetical protein